MIYDNGNMVAAKMNYTCNTKSVVFVWRLHYVEYSDTNDLADWIVLLIKQLKLPYFESGEIHFHKNIVITKYIDNKIYW